MPFQLSSPLHHNRPALSLRCCRSCTDPSSVTGSEKSFISKGPKVYFAVKFIHTNPFLISFSGASQLQKDGIKQRVFLRVKQFLFLLSLFFYFHSMQCFYRMSSYRTWCFTAKSDHGKQTAHLNKENHLCSLNWLNQVSAENDKQITSSYTNTDGGLVACWFYQWSVIMTLSLFLCRYCLHRLTSKYPLLFALELSLVSIICHHCWALGYS